VPFGNNMASRRALEKAGFVQEAKRLGTLVKNGRAEDE
jgi:RimJ/RimL family protein N-acetyltransferase